MRYVLGESSGNLFLWTRRRGDLFRLSVWLVALRRLSRKRPNALVSLTPKSGHFQQIDGGVGVCGRDVFAIAGKGDVSYRTAHLPGTQFLGGCGVPELDPVILSGRGKLLAIGADREGNYASFMGFE